MATKQIKIGDRVRIRNGGKTTPEMRVTDVHGVGGCLATCMWSDGDMNRTLVFPAEMLERKD